MSNKQSITPENGIRRNSVNANGGGRVSPHTGRSTPSSRRSPKGRRSPNTYYERTTTVRFVQPPYARAVCTKLNRVQRTQAKAENGAQLCEKFLNGHCEQGAACRFVHVPKQYIWDFLTPTVDHTRFTYVEGFNVRCYTPQMDAYYDIPSECIYATRGSERYVELFNDNGDNFKEKCTLCPEMQGTGTCERGGECEYVHCCYADMSAFPCIHTHIAELQAMTHYERLPADVCVRVFQPNSNDECEDFPGDDVLRTVGATQYEDTYRRDGCVPSVKMQHCAHFQSKKMCRLGDGCRFLHVVSIALNTPAKDDADTYSPRTSPVSQSRNGFAVATVAASDKNQAAMLAATELLQSFGAIVNDDGAGPTPNRANTSTKNGDAAAAPTAAATADEAAYRRRYAADGQHADSGAAAAPRVPGSTRRHNPYGTAISPH